MDSLSQLVLGAAIGEAILGKELGNKAIVWGMVFGTMPDLDIIMSPLLNELESLTVHRGISHSLFFSLFISIALGWLLSKITKHKIAVSRIKWQLMIFCAYSTHIILDCFTIYGTQILAPFSNYKISWGTISIIDPIYTIILIISSLIIIFLKRTMKLRRVVNYIGLVISSMYLLLTVYNKYRIEQIFLSQAEAININVQRIMTVPTLGNNILWSCTIESNDAYYQGCYSFFDNLPIKFHEIDKAHELVKKPELEHTIKVLSWYCDNYYCIREINGEIHLIDLRWSRNNTKSFYNKHQDLNTEFIYTFQLNHDEDNYIVSKCQNNSVDFNQWMKAVYKRIWSD